MRRLLHFSAFVWLLISFGQCTNEPLVRPLDDKPSLSQNEGGAEFSARQLAENADFVELTRITNRFQDVLYNNLRDAHSEKLRTVNSRRIGSLLQHKDNKDSLALAVKKMGFTDLNQFLFDLKRIDALRVSMGGSGIHLDKMPFPVLVEAQRMVSKNLDHSYPTIFNLSGGFVPSAT